MQLLPLLFGLNRAFPQTLTILCAFVLPDSFCSWEKKKVTPHPSPQIHSPFLTIEHLLHTHIPQRSKGAAASIQPWGGTWGLHSFFNIHSVEQSGGLLEEGYLGWGGGFGWFLSCCAAGVEEVVMLSNSVYQLWADVNMTMGLDTGWSCALCQQHLDWSGP